MKNNLKRPILLVMTLIIIIGIGIASGLLIQPDDPFEGDAVVNPPFTPLTYSIQTFMWWDEGDTGSQAAMVNRVFNFSHIKQTFPWREIEPRQDEWDFSQSDRIVDLVEEWDLQLIVRLGQSPAWASGIEISEDYNSESHDAPAQSIEDFADYCGQIAERYVGRIAAYQIWNEPNLAREWGEQTPDPLTYVEHLIACSAAIREVDNTVILISAGLAPTGGPMPYAMPDDQYLDQMYRANFQDHIDVVGAHAPGFAPPAYGPDDAEQEGHSRWASYRRVEDLRKIMLLHDDAERQMAILEFGYTTDTNNPDYSWFAVSEELQAQYIVEAYQYAAEHWRPWVGLMNLIYLPDPEWTWEDEEWWWAVIRPDGVVREAYWAISDMERYCGDRVVSGWDNSKYSSEDDWLERRDTCT